MTRPAGIALWRSWLRCRWLRMLGGALGALIAMGYLGGYLFLWSMRLDPTAASPVTLVRYLYFHARHAQVRRHAIASAAAAAGVMTAIAAPLLWPKQRSLHGDARFASHGEIECAGLLGEHGIILGAWRGRCLMLAGQQGVALAAPPRSGKGVGVVVP